MNHTLRSKFLLVLFLIFVGIAGEYYSEIADAKGHLSLDIGKSYSAKVVRVNDGDTVVVEHDGEQFGVRLAYIDSPETKQRGGRVAGSYLSGLVSNKMVKVKVIDIDRYGRYVGLVYLGGEDVNLKMIEAGHAWHYTFFSKNQSSKDYELYQLAESKARRDKVGLWSDPNPEEPWEWRRYNKGK